MAVRPGTQRGGVAVLEAGDRRGQLFGCCGWRDAGVAYGDGDGAGLEAGSSRSNPPRQASAPEFLSDLFWGDDPGNL